jgi:Mor family transcriptional regulator
VLADTGLADYLALGYADLICRHFSGEQVYFAATEWYEREMRDRLIFEQHTREGRSLRWLADHHQLGKSSVDEIVQRMRSRDAQMT